MRATLTAKDDTIKARELTIASQEAELAMIKKRLDAALAAVDLTALIPANGTQAAAPSEEVSTQAAALLVRRFVRNTVTYGMLFVSCFMQTVETCLPICACLASAATRGLQLCLFVCLSGILPVCVSGGLYVYLSGILSVCVSFSLSVYLSQAGILAGIQAGILPVCVWGGLLVCLCVCLSASQAGGLSVYAIRWGAQAGACSAATSS
jgi:hypothetical protein